MENKNESKLKANVQTLRLIAIFAINIMIIVAAVIMAFKYYDSQVNLRYETVRANFSATVRTMERVAYGYLRSEQSICDNWSQYISRNDMTVEEALNFANKVDSNKSTMTHIIYYDTLEGYSTVNGPDGSNTVSYADKSDGLISLFREVENCTHSGVHPHITRAYINPTNNVQSVGFCHDIEVINEDGVKVHALLIRIAIMDELREQWVFPTGYEKAELIMIDSDGAYVVQSKSMGGNNFYDFIAEQNDLSAEEREKLKRTVTENADGDLSTVNADFEFLNAEGEKSIFSYHEVQFNNDWTLIGYIPQNDIVITPVDLTIVTIAIFGFLVIIIMDGGYILIVNKRLKESMTETQKANEAKTRFLSSMSHDIRTPMNAIIGMTAIAFRHLDDSEQVRECLRKITQASNHLLTLINDILDISKVESGKLSLNPVVFSLAESSENLINVVQPMVKEKELDFDVRAHNISQEFIYADELRINQIFINLLSNAVKYTPVGGKVWLEIEQQPSEKPDCIRLTYTVSDTGIGMSNEFMKKMYTAFTRDNDTRVSAIQGTGLGLAITKQMVDLMGGTIEVKSKLGEGSQFKVTLDLQTAKKTTEDLTLPPIKLLVVDDDEVFLESAKDVMSSLGVDADTASNGEEAVKMVSERHDRNDDYPCVILDWKMPGMDGLEATRAIRAKVGDDIPVIIISAYDRTDIEDEAREAGASGFISKPLFPSTVYSKMNEIFHFDDSMPVASEDNGDDLKGINLLIAEDNDINWEIIDTLLKFCGITAERAENGKICVEKINAAADGTYQAILMDIQMPVMNGREAAENIRNSSREYVKNIPIIAMTADAFAEDIRSCMDAGMNGHVAKPLDMKKLFKELRKVVRK